MKKVFLFLSVIIITISVKSQKVQLGPELGMNIIPMENTDVGYNFQLGYHFGLNLRYSFSEHFKLSTGAFLTQKKKSYSYTTTGSLMDAINLPPFVSLPGNLPIDSILNIPGLNTDTRSQINGTVSELFIEIPLLANFHANHFNVYLGPYIGILLTANRKEATTTEIPLLDVIDIESLDSTGFLSLFLPASGETNTTQSSNKDNLNLIDFGFNAGIGYEINNLHFNLMYSYGLLDYRKDKGNQKKSTLKTLRISIAYLFDLSKNKGGNARFK